MMTVVSLSLFANASSGPTVVLVEPLRKYRAAPRMLATPDIDMVLENCRRILSHCRQVGPLIAFARLLGNSASSPSCYSNEPFASLMSHSPDGFVLAYFSGEAACLSTLVDAYHRKRRAVFLHDASASHDLDEVPATDVHHAG